MRPKKEFSSKQEKKIIEEYSSGTSMKHLSIKYDVSIPVIRRTLVKNNIQIKSAGSYRKNSTEKFEKDMIEAYLSGNSMQKIATQHSVSITIVNRVLVENNIKIRSKGPYYKQVTERDAQIVKLYQIDRKSVTEIAKIVKLSRQSIYSILNRQNISVTSNRPVVSRALDLYKYICEYKQENDGNTPPMREMQKASRIYTYASLMYALKWLEEQNLIERKKNEKIIVLGATWRPPIHVMRIQTTHKTS